MNTSLPKRWQNCLNALNFNFERSLSSLSMSHGPGINDDATSPSDAKNVCSCVLGIDFCILDQHRLDIQFSMNSRPAPPSDGGRSPKVDTSFKIMFVPLCITVL